MKYSIEIGNRNGDHMTWTSAEGATRSEAEQSALRAYDPGHEQSGGCVVLSSMDEGEEHAWRVTLARHLRECYGEGSPSLKALREKYPQDAKN